MRVKYSQIANVILYIIMAVYVIDIGDWKYVVLYFATAVLLMLNYVKNSGLEFSEFLYEGKWILSIFATFVVITIIKQIFNGFNSYFINEIIYFCSPVIFVFAFLQLQDKQSIFHTIDGLFIFYIVVFFVRTWGQLDFAHIKQISFANTYSPFEGTGLAFIFTPFVFYFYYKKKLPLEIISLVIVFLTMKRMAFFTAVFVVLLSLLTYHKQVSRMTVKKWMVAIACAIFIILPVVAYFLLNDSFESWFYAKTGLEINAFTMTRFERMNMVTDAKAGRWGWGGTTTYLSRNFPTHFYEGANYNVHNDVYKVFLEMGIAGSIVFTIGLFKLSRKSYVAFLLIFYMFLEMFVNHMMGAGTVDLWIFYYLMIYSLNKGGHDDQFKEPQIKKANEGEISE